MRTVGALVIFGPLCIDLYLPALPELTGDLGGSQAAGQLSLSTCVFGLALGQLFFGMTSDQYGRRRPVLLGVAGFVLASIACALAPSMWVFLVGRALQGFCGASGVVIGRAIVRDTLAGRDAARVMSLLIVISGVVPLVAPIVGAELLTFVSWRALFGFLAVAGLVSLVAAWHFPESLREENRTADGITGALRVGRTLIRDNAFVGFAFCIAFQMATMFTYLANSPFLVQDLMGHSAVVFGLMFTINSVGLLAVSRIGASLVRRTGPHVLLISGLVMVVAGSTALLVTSLLIEPNLVVFVMCTFFVVSSIGFVLPNSVSLALVPYAKGAGAAAAWMGFAQYMGGGLASPIAGLGSHESVVPTASVMVIGALASSCAAGWASVHMRARLRRQAVASTVALAADEFAAPPA
jgi:DHA1 family bicyclomycin/chloramphenicol resistance-like MFS transporter